MLWDPYFFTRYFFNFNQYSINLVHDYLVLTLECSFNNNFSPNCAYHIKKKMHAWFIEKFIFLFIYFIFFLGKSIKKYYCLWMEKSGHNQFSGVRFEKLKRPVRKKSLVSIMAKNWGVNPELWRRYPEYGA